MNQGKKVVVIGASSDRSKFSNKAVRAYRAQGWEVYPVNPKGGKIEGLVVFSHLADVPSPIDRITLYLPPAVGLTMLQTIAAAKPVEFFINPGAESPELVREAERLGLSPILACSIVDIGTVPAMYPD